MRHNTLLRLLAFLRPMLGWVALAVLLAAATTTSSIALLGTSAYLLATAALHPSISILQVAIVGVRFFGISRAVLRYLERLVSHSVNFRHLAQLRLWLYQKLEPLAPARLVLTRSSDLLGSIVADIDSLEDFYVRAVAPPLAGGIVVAGVVLWTFHYDSTLALVLLAGLLLVGLALPLLVYKLGRDAGRAVIEQRAGLQAVLLDSVQGLADLLAFGRGRAQAALIDCIGRRATIAQQRLAQVGALGNALATLITGLTVWGLLLLAVPKIGSQFDGVGLVVLVLVALASFEAVTPLIAAAQHLEGSLQAGRRIFAAADSTPAVVEPVGPLLAPSPDDVQIRGLTFFYPGESVPALIDFDLDLPRGKHVALVGPSGAGKTTLLRLLLRFWDAPAGTIFWNGQDIHAYSSADTRRWIGLAAQDGYVFTGSLRQNILLARPEADAAAVERAVWQAQLGQLVALLPDGLDTWVGERGLRLSGGERQRLMLARAFLRDAPLLLLDEPTAHLDHATERSLIEAIRDAWQNRTLVAVTHHLSGLEAMDEILVLQEGRVVERGTHAALLAGCGRYARMWEIEQSTLDQLSLPV